MDFITHNQPRHQALWNLARETPGLDLSSVESYFLFLRVANDVLSALQEHLDQYELSDGKFAVLMILRQHSEHCMNPSQIAEAIGVTRSTMTGLLSGLERAELVSRQTDEDDGRTAPITLTPRGEDLLEGLLPRHFAHIHELMSHLDDTEKQQLIDLLEKVAIGIPSLRTP